MPQQSFAQQLANIGVAGTLYNTFTAAKSMLTAAATTEASAGAVKVPAGYWQRGSGMLLLFHGAMSWASGNTMIASVMMGAVAVFTSAALKVTTTGGTTEPVFGLIMLTGRAQGTGTLANLMGGGFICGRGIAPAGSAAGANYTAGMGFAMLQEATPAVGTGFDSTIDNTLDFQITMGTSSASNGFQMLQWMPISPGNAGF